MFSPIVILKLHSCHVDYAQSFSQAELEDPVYMCFPQGWYINNRQVYLQQHHTQNIMTRHTTFVFTVTCMDARKLPRDLLGFYQSQIYLFYFLKETVLWRYIHVIFL
jgi:hypothetical protein